VVVILAGCVCVCVCVYVCVCVWGGWSMKIARTASDHVDAATVPVVGTYAHAEIGNAVCVCVLCRHAVK